MDILKEAKECYRNFNLEIAENIFNKCENNKIDFDDVSVMGNKMNKYQRDLTKAYFCFKLIGQYYLEESKKNESQPDYGEAGIVINEFSNYIKKDFDNGEKVLQAIVLEKIPEHLKELRKKTMN